MIYWFSQTIFKWNFKFWITVPFQSGWAHLLRIQQGFVRQGPNLAGAPNDQWHLEQLGLGHPGLEVSFLACHHINLKEDFFKIIFHKYFEGYLTKDSKKIQDQKGI